MLVGYQYSRSTRKPRIRTYQNSVPRGSMWECSVAVVRQFRLLVTGKFGVRNPSGGNGWQRWGTEYMGEHSVDQVGSSDFGSK